MLTYTNSHKVTYTNSHMYLHELVHVPPRIRTPGPLLIFSFFFLSC
jgi:hypothetical protein